MTVVRCGGFSAAQATLNVSQSTISEQMTTLETRLGLKLCERGRSGFRLTEHGVATYEAAQRLQVAVESFCVDTDALKTARLGKAVPRHHRQHGDRLGLTAAAGTASVRVEGARRASGCLCRHARRTGRACAGRPAAHRSRAFSASRAGADLHRSLLRTGRSLLREGSRARRPIAWRRRARRGHRVQPCCSARVSAAARPANAQSE